MRCVRFISITLLAIVLSASTNAQVLHGQWFKATATASGASVSGELDVTPAKFKKITHYVRFALDEGFGSHVYGAEIWVENAGGEWVPFDGGVIVMADAEETYVAFGSLTFYVSETIPVETLAEAAGTPALQGFDVEFNGPSKVKVKGKEVKSATIKSDGAIAGGSFTGDDNFVGGAKVSLKLVPESKLPFNPIVMLKAEATQRAKPSWRSQTTGAPPAVVSQH